MIRFRETLPLYAVIFLGFFGYALTITLFIPMIMDKSFLILSPETPVAVRATLSGFLLAMYPLGQFFGSPIMGNFSDYFGRKKVLLLSLVACTFGFIGMGLSIKFHQLEWLFISSFVTGLCESNMAISQSIIADRAEDIAEKTKLIGYAYSACSLGYIVGPLLGGAGASYLSYSSPFWITAIGVLALVIWMFYGFHEQSFVKKQKTINILQSFMAIKSIFSNRNLFKIYIINFFIFFSVQGLYRVVPLYVVDEWNPSLRTYSLLIAFVSLMCFIANLAFLGKLAKHFASKLLLAGLLLSGGFFVILIIFPCQFNWIWVTYGIAVIPTVMALPTCTTWLSERASQDEQGQVLGNNQALLVLGEASSAAIGGLIAAIWIPLPIVILGMILLVTGMFVLKTED